MELRHLQHFIAVAEEQNFTRAAQRVHIVQSALSTSILCLEKELNARLFVRTTRGVGMTPAGRAFLEKAREALRVIETGRETVASISGLRSGSLSIGAVQSLPAFIDLPSLFAQFHAAFPGIEVRLRQGDALGLMDQLRSGQLDLALLPLLEPPDGIMTTIVACEDLVAITPPDHPLAGREGVALKELIQYPHVDFEIGWGTRPLIDLAFARAGIQRRTVFDVTDLETVIDLVAKGLGIALLPETIAATRVPSIGVAELAEPAICWELLVAHFGADPSPVNEAAAAFLELLDSY
jgi:DNA-binding transcriptional LysR family regulator